MSEELRKQPEEELSQQASTDNNPEQEISGTSEFHFFPNKEQRMLLGKAVEDLIDEVKISSQDGVPNVIFLDNSARPLSTIFLDLWVKKYPGEKKPNISFLNIGRELIKNNSEKDGDGKDKFQMEEDILKEEVKRVKKQYLYLKKAPSGSVITIADDVESFGFSKDASLKILKEAFPDLEFRYHPLTKVRDMAIHMLTILRLVFLIKRNEVDFWV